MKVAETYYDEIFDFAGQWEQPSKCGLKILTVNGKKIIIVTELYQDNPGTSITATAGSLFLQICEKKGLRPADVIYLECNPDTNSKLSFYDEKYFQVTFSEENGKYVRPQYKELTREETNNLLTS